MTDHVRERNERIAAGLRTRDPASLALLIAAYAGDLRTTARLILGDETEADDVLLDTLATAWERAGQLRDPSALGAWLYRIAVNHSLARRRRFVRNLRSRVIVTPLVLDDHAPEVVARIVVARALSQLPPRIRAAIALHYFADLTVDQVADALGRSPNTIKSQLRVGLDRLRAELGARNERSVPEAERERF